MPLLFFQWEMQSFYPFPPFYLERGLGLRNKNGLSQRQSYGRRVPFHDLSRPEGVKDGELVTDSPSQLWPSQWSPELQRARLLSFQHTL